MKIIGDDVKKVKKVDRDTNFVSYSTRSDIFF